MFQDELQFFIDNQEQLVKEHFGKVLLIRGKNIEGVYSCALDAYLDGQKKFTLGTFMIQPCEPGPAAYTVTINA